jgi:hypothetical protein
LPFVQKIKKNKSQLWGRKAEKKKNDGKKNWLFLFALPMFVVVPWQKNYLKRR